MSATYQGLRFSTPLHAQWAAFFDLSDWTWHANPAAIGNWQPDFLVSFPCSHSECSGKHTLLVSVGPFRSVAELSGHIALGHNWQVLNNQGVPVADAGAVFGDGPHVSKWEMAHGAGGGEENVANWVLSRPEDLWQEAGKLVRRG